jgi:hypothetical protein
VICDVAATSSTDLLCLYSFVYNRPNDGLVEAETCRNYIINDNCLFTIDGAICWIKYKSYVEVRDLVSELRYISFLS